MDQVSTPLPVAGHPLHAAQREAVLAAYPAHEREARTRCAVMMPRVARTEPRCRWCRRRKVGGWG